MGKALIGARWLLDRGKIVALWGARRPEQLTPVREVMGWTLDESDYRTGGPARYVKVAETGGLLTLAVLSVVVVLVGVAVVRAVVMVVLVGVAVVAVVVGVFVRVVEGGGFSAAARALRMTPSAVSKLISRLEFHLL